MVIKKIFIIVLLLLFSCRDRMYKEAEQIVKLMTLEQKIGQMMMIGVPGKEVTEETVSMIERYYPGGIILFGYNIAGREDLQNNAEFSKKRTDSLFNDNFGSSLEKHKGWGNGKIVLLNII